MQTMKSYLTVLSIAIGIMLCGCAPKTSEQLEKERMQNVTKAVQQARNLIFDGKPSEATKVLEAANKDYGETAQSCEMMAHAFEQMGKLGFAAIYYEKSYALNSDNPNLLLYAAKYYEQSESYAPALNCYKKYLEANPKDALAWKLYAKLLETQNLPEESLNAYMAAVKTSNRNPTSSEAASIGLLFLKLKNKVQARQWLESAFDATVPENKEVRTQILCGLISLYLSEKDTASLTRTVEMLKSVNPEVLAKEHPTLEAEIKEFYAELEKAKRAIADAEKAKQEEELKKLEEAKRQEEEAMKKLEEAKNAEKQKALEATEGKTESTEATVKDVEQPMETAEEKMVRVSYEKIKEGEPKFAEKVANEFLKDDGRNSQYWVLLAKSYEAQSKDNEAYFAAREALRYNENDLNTTLYSLRTASKVLNNEKFIDALALAREKFPYNPEIMLGLARTYVEMKDFKNAKHFYNLFFEYASKEHPLHEEVENEFAAVTSAANQ